MVVVHGSRLFWKDRLVFFATEAEIHKMTENMGPNVISRFWQTTARLERPPGIVERGCFDTNCIDLRRPLTVLHGEMDRTCRYQIRKAMRRVDRIEVGLNAGPGEDQEFLTLYNAFARRKGDMSPVPHRRFAEYRQVSDVWLLRLDGRPVCGHLFIRDEKSLRVRLIYSATDRLEGNIDPRISSALNRYLHWEEVQRYQSQGFEVYDFGGIANGNCTVSRFKLSFGGSPIRENTYVFASPLGWVAYRAYHFIPGAVRGL